MKLKTPVIATKTGGIPEIIDDNRTGILCENERPDLLASAIKSLLDNPLLSKQISESGYEEFKNRFSADIFINKHIELYSKIKRN
ncbi:Glycosyl transferases group 1 [Alkaliphilus peptidifermentans DSM 18978]|uniref:Glycosyl transferases group 1 n=1 Tax=Alkaliphilus peptidifermentans DSM 18978 TaxID=1120976 RepID=A0A1G5HLA3_9FIRM|nr:Glycosyl transferases group 1 [Alkaliphilus peptidifermentans DSM 18978]